VTLAELEDDHGIVITNPDVTTIAGIVLAATSTLPTVGTTVTCRATTSPSRRCSAARSPAFASDRRRQRPKRPSTATTMTEVATEGYATIRTTIMIAATSSSPRTSQAARSLTSSDRPPRPKDDVNRRAGPIAEPRHTASPEWTGSPIMTGSIGWLSLNVMVWLVIAFGAGWYHRRATIDRLDHDGFFLRLREFEAGGDWYERHLRIKAWKGRVPETGGRGGGMSKRHLPGRDRVALEQFAAECRRGERTHWTIAAAGPAFLLWNSSSDAIAIAIANAAGNTPFVAILRYNRARIVATLGRRQRPSARCQHDILPSIRTGAGEPDA
jgi:glycosyl-4,4'-diaponeurosporenoate acyltransferase